MIKRFEIGSSSSEIVSHGGLSLIGQAIKRHTNLVRSVNRQVPLRHGIRHSDILLSYLVLLCMGKNDFDTINGVESELFFMMALGLDNLPSEATLRQRLDGNSALMPIVDRVTTDFLKSIKAELTSVATGHIPLDMDVTLLDILTARRSASRALTKGLMVLRQWQRIWVRKGIAWNLSFEKVSSITKKIPRRF